MGHSLVKIGNPHLSSPTISISTSTEDITSQEAIPNRIWSIPNYPISPSKVLGSTFTRVKTNKVQRVGTGDRTSESPRPFFISYYLYTSY